MANGNSKVQDKIKKLLALAASDNEHEANTAMRQAMRLMAKHNVSEEDLRDSEMVIEKFPIYYSTVPKHLRFLLVGIAEAMGAGVVLHPVPPSLKRNGRNRGKQHHSTYSVIGLKHDVEYVNYMFEVVSRIVDNKLAKFKKDNYPTSRAENNDYKLGIVLGFCEKLSDANSEIEQGKGLVPVDDRVENAYSFFEKSRGTKLTTTRTSYRAGDAHNAGSIDVNKGVRGGVSSQARLGHG